jgi:hypothetical protein
MNIFILTVDKNEIYKLKNKFYFLNNGYNTVEIFLGKKAKNYSNKSDRNSKVKKSIYENTKKCVIKNCKKDDDFVLVFQSDATFSNKKEVIEGIDISKNFLLENKDVDMFMLGYNPNIKYVNSNTPGIIKINKAIHWQGVIFRKSLFKKYPVIPYGIHSDIYISSKMKKNILCYGLRKSIIKQNTNHRLIRKFEYDLFYHTRCNYKNGDPLIKIFIIVLLVIFVIIIYKSKKFIL